MAGNRDVKLTIRAKDNTAKAFDAISKSLSRIFDAQAKLDTQSRSIDAAFGRNYRSVRGLGGEYDNFSRGQLATARNGLNTLASGLDKARSHIEDHKRSLASLEAQYDAVQKQRRAAETYVARQSNNLPQNEEGVAKLRAAKQALAQLSREGNQLSAALQRARGELGEMNARLRTAENQSIAAGAAYRKAFSDRSAIRAQGEIARLNSTVSQSALIMARWAIGIKDSAVNFKSLVREARRASAELGYFTTQGRRVANLQQRLRGQALGLAASYVGLHGVIEAARYAIEAFGIAQAAQVRLSSIFEGDQESIRQEMAYITAEADRLGIQYGVLVNSYTKFAVATKANGFTMEQTRKIFRQVTEGARVLKLTNDQLEGSLVALTQIAGKGTLQMEELRQQLGDRFTGAVAIMAKGLGYGEESMADFYKAVEQGQIGAKEALVAFGDEIQRRFGGELDDVLDNLNTKIGRFQNAIFKGALRGANAGFAEQLGALLDELTEFFESDEGKEYFESLGSAAGKVLRIMQEVVPLIPLFAKIFALTYVYRFTQGIIGLGVQLKGRIFDTAAFRTAVAQLDRRLIGVNGTSKAWSFSLRGMRVAAIGARTAAAGLMGLFGGPIGLAVFAFSTIATELFAGWLGSVDSANEALADHADILGEVDAAYVNSGGNAAAFRKELESISRIEALNNLNAAIKETKRAFDKFRLHLGRESIFGGRFNLGQDFTDYYAPKYGFEEQADKLNMMADAMARGEINASEMREAIDEFTREVDNAPPYLLKLLGALDEQLETMEKTGKATAEAEAILALIDGTATEAQKALLGLANEADGAADGGDDATDAYGKFNDALEEMRGLLPEVGRSFNSLDDSGKIAAIEEHFQAALLAAQQLPEAVQRIGAAATALDLRNLQMIQLYGVTDFQTDVDFIKQFEGLKLQAYEDQLANGELTIGYGHTNLAGGFRVGQNTRITEAQANAILAHDLEMFRAQVDALVKVPLTESMRAALVSYQYNTGALAGSQIIALLNESNYTGAQAAIADGIDTAEGEYVEGLEIRRQKEAALFGAQGFNSPEIAASAIESQIKAEEESARLAEEKAQAQRDFNAERQAGIAQAQFELSIAQLELQEREVAKALRDAELEAEGEGVILSQAQREEIERVTRAKFAQQASEEALARLNEEAQRQETAINALVEQRNRLIERRNQLVERGDRSGAFALDAEIKGVNQKLDEAIGKWEQFWASAKGRGADVQVAENIANVKVEIEDLGEQTVVTAEQINTSIADKLTNGVRSFFEQVRQGTPAIVALRTVFLQAVGEMLIDLGLLIIKQALFNAISGSFGGAGGVGGLISNGINTLFAHSGAVVGVSGGTTRHVSPAVFANAVRYHSGGIVGLKPNEVPAILERNEEVLTANDPRHINNGGGAKQQPIKVVNAFDTGDLLSQALDAPNGERVFLNFVKKNADAIGQALGR